MNLSRQPSGRLLSLRSAAAVAIAFGRWRVKYVLSTPAVVSVKPASRWHDWMTWTFLITVALHVKPSKPASQAQIPSAQSPRSLQSARDAHFFGVPWHHVWVLGTVASQQQPRSWHSSSVMPGNPHGRPAQARSRSARSQKPARPSSLYARAAERSSHIEAKGSMRGTANSHGRLEKSSARARRPQLSRRARPRKIPTKWPTTRTSPTRTPSGSPTSSRAPPRRPTA